MGQTLTNGVYLPDNGERNCYVGLSQNWQKLDNLLGNKGDKVSFAQTLTEGVEIGKITINGVDIAMYHTDYSHKADADNVYTKAEVDASLSAKADKATTLSGYGITDAYTKVQVENKISELVNSAPETLDTLNELASALGNDPNFATTIANQIGTKANDSDVVHLTGNETISGTKTFRNITLKSSRIERGALPASNITEDREIEIVDKNNRRILGIFNYYYTSGSGRTSFYAYNPNTTDYDNIAIAMDFDNTNNQKSLLPVGNNTINLGTSTNKWKTINGVNPGALSLPSISNTGANAWIALDTTNWVKFVSVNTSQKYIPLADGWLNVRVDNATILAIASGGNYMHQMIRSETPNSLALLMPVFKNEQVAIMVSGNENLAYNRATFYYCQGNV